MSLETSSPSPSISSSDPSTTLPIRYFDLLPPELLMHIIEYAAVQGRRCQTPFEEDKATLRSLCLTSKLFRSLAQPLLLRTFELTDSQGRESIRLLLKKNTPKALLSIRRMYLWNSSYGSYRLGHLYELARFVENLTELWCARLYSYVQPFLGSNVAILCLYRIDIPAIPDFDFPRLKVMGLWQCNFEGVPRFSLPLLQHLDYASSDYPLDAEQIQFLDNVTPTLSSVSWNLTDAQTLPPSIASNRSIAVCFDAEVNDIRSRQSKMLTQVEHLRLWYHHLEEGYRVEDLDEQIRRLEPWTTLIDEAPRLETLILYGGEGVITQHQKLEEACQKLVAVCQRRQIKVIWQECTRADDFWDLLCPSFLRMAKERSLK